MKYEKLLSEKGKAQWADPEIRARRMKTFRSKEFRKQQSRKQKEVSQNPKYGNSAAAHKKRFKDPRHKEKLSQALKEAWAKDDGTRRRKASKLAKKVYEANKDKITKAKQKAKSKYYGKVISPEGKIVEVYGAAKFCRENNSPYNGANYGFLNGTLKTYKGWCRFE